MICGASRRSKKTARRTYTHPPLRQTSRAIARFLARKRSHLPGRKKLGRAGREGGGGVKTPRIAGVAFGRRSKNGPSVGVRSRGKKERTGQWMSGRKKRTREREGARFESRETRGRIARRRAVAGKVIEESKYRLAASHSMKRAR